MRTPPQSTKFVVASAYHALELSYGCAKKIELSHYVEDTTTDSGKATPLFRQQWYNGTATFSCLERSSEGDHLFENLELGYKTQFSYYQPFSMFVVG